MPDPGQKEHCRTTEACTLIPDIYYSLVGWQRSVGQYHSRYRHDQQTARSWWQRIGKCITGIWHNYSSPFNVVRREIWQERWQCSVAGPHNDQYIRLLPGSNQPSLFNCDVVFANIVIVFHENDRRWRGTLSAHVYPSLSATSGRNHAGAYGMHLQECYDNGSLISIQKNPEKREAQRVLANEATELVHGCK